MIEEFQRILQYLKLQICRKSKNRRVYQWAQNFLNDITLLVSSRADRKPLPQSMR